MTLYLGSIPANSTIYIPFATYDGITGTSETCSGLAVTDIEIYKNGGATQRASDAGYTLLDTDGIDFDGITGINGFSIDLSDNTDAGFYLIGSWYWVIVSSITADAQTVNFVAAVFRIGPAEVSAAVATDVGNSATVFKTTLTSATDNYWNDALLLITSGALVGQVKRVTDYDGTNKIITVGTGFTDTPADDVTFLMINK